jgi:lysophospholipase L1-like esterase
MRFRKSYMLFNALILVLIGGMFLLNVLLYRWVQSQYLELNQMRLDPLGLSRYPTGPEPNSMNHRPRVIFFGDSRAYAWQPPDIQGYEFINRGINGQTTEQSLRRYDYHVRPLNPSVVVIQIGVNDLKNIALFPDQKQSIITNCKNNIEQIVEKSLNTQATVILTTIFPTGEIPFYRQPFWSNEVDLAIREVNMFLSTLATEKVILFDNVPILTNGKDNVLPTYSLDELHLNQSGYKVLNQKLAQILESLKEEKKK